MHERGSLREGEREREREREREKSFCDSGQTSDCAAEWYFKYRERQRHSGGGFVR